MKGEPGFLLVQAVLLPLAVAASVSAQSGDGYDLTWNTVDGGGGPSRRAPATRWGARSAKRMRAR